MDQTNEEVYALEDIAPKAMDETYDHLARQLRNESNNKEVYALEGMQANDGDYAQALGWGSGNEENNPSMKRIENDGDNDAVYASANESNLPNLKEKTFDKHIFCDIAPTSSSSIPSSCPEKIKFNEEEKWGKMKRTFAIIFAIFALASFCIGVVSLIQQFSSTSEMEIQKLLRRFNELEESMKTELEETARSCNARTDELENLLHISDANCNNSTQAINASVSELETKTAEVELSVFKLHGWFILNGYRYKSTVEKTTWQEGSELCEKEGGDLAAVGMRNISYRTQIGDAVLTDNSPVWIGLERALPENHFVWIDNVNSTEENTHWESEEPNDKSGNEDCGEISKTESYLTNDEECSEQRYGICEIILLFNNHGSEIPDAPKT